MNAIELISAGVTAMGFGAIVWATAHEPATEPEPEPVEPPNGDDWQWDGPYQRSLALGLTEDLAAYEQRLDRMNRTATTARQRYQNQTGEPQ